MIKVKNIVAIESAEFRQTVELLSMVYGIYGKDSDALTDNYNGMIDVCRQLIDSENVLAPHCASNIENRSFILELDMIYTGQDYLIVDIERNGEDLYVEVVEIKNTNEENDGL